MTIPMIDNEIMWERMSLEESLRSERVISTRHRRVTAVVIFSALALAWEVMLIGHASAAQSGGAYAERPSASGVSGHPLKPRVGGDKGRSDDASRGE